MGSNNSSPKRFEDIKDDTNEEKKNPLVSKLERRRKRKLGIIQDISTGKIYKKMKESPNILPAHLNKCLEWHKTKPWLGKSVKFTLMAYPTIGQNPPEDLKVFFTSIPFIGTTSKERKEIVDNGGGYKWFLPSKFLWSAHCFVQHQKDSHIVCDVDNLVRTFTDESGTQQSFIFAVVFNDETIKILDRSDYEKECKWWNQHTVATGGYGEKNIFLRTKSINSEEGKIARNIMRKRISSIFSAISKPIDSNSSLVTEMDQEFMNAIKSQGKNTIFDYVTHCLAILIFIKPESPLYKYTTAFRRRLVAGYYKNSAIPRLETFDMFPDFYASNKSSQDIDRVKQWIKTYHDQEIDDFFNILISSLDSTISKPTRPRDEIFDLSDDLKPEPIEEQCPDMGDTSLEDILLYKDANNRLFCFSIDQLIDLEDDTNPLDPTGPKISPDFLYKFKKNFKGLKKELKAATSSTSSTSQTKKKEDGKCTHCKAFIDEYVLRTGSVVKDGDELKSKVQDFCSVECLENYKKLEELFGPEEEDEDEHKEEIHNLEERFENQKKDLEERYQSQLDELNSKYNDLHEKLAQSESTIRLLRSGNSKAESEKQLLTQSISEKEKILNKQKDTLIQLQNEISSKTGRDLRNLSVSDIIGLMDKKDPVRDRKAAEYDTLVEQIKKGQQIIGDDKREMVRLNEVIERNTASIEGQELIIRESKNVEQTLRNEISQMREKHQEAFNTKSREMTLAITERNNKIDLLTEEISKMENDKVVHTNKEKLDRIASIEEMKKQISIAKRETEEKRQQLEVQNFEFKKERDKLSEELRTTNDINNTLARKVSIKEEEIKRLQNQREEILKKADGIPELEHQIEVYKQNGNKNKLRDSEIQLDLLRNYEIQNIRLQSQIDSLQTEILTERANLELCRNETTKDMCKNKIDEYTNQLQAQNGMITTLNERIKILSSQQVKCDDNSKLVAEMELLKADREELIVKDQTLRKELDARNLEVSDMAAKIRDSKGTKYTQGLQIENNRIKKELNDERLKLAEEIKKNKDKFDKSLDNANTLQYKLDQARNELKAADEKLTGSSRVTEQQLKEQQDEVRNINEKLTHAKKEIEQHLNTISELEEKQKNCDRNIHDTGSDISSIKESKVKESKEDEEATFSAKDNKRLADETAKRLAAETAKRQADAKAEKEARRLAAEEAEAQRQAAEEAEDQRQAAEDQRQAAEETDSAKRRADTKRLAEEAAEAKAKRLAAEEKEAEAKRLAAEEKEAEAQRLAAAEKTEQNRQIAEAFKDIIYKLNNPPKDELDS